MLNAVILFPFTVAVLLTGNTALAAVVPTLRSVTPLETRSSSSTCPGTLQSVFYSPSVIVPISKRLPNVALPASPFGITSPGDLSTIFNFNVPSSVAGKNCTLEFFFPSYSQNAGIYLYSGPGDFVFTGYNPGSGAVAGTTTYNNQPQAGPYPSFPPIVLSPGNAYVIDVGPCIPGIVSGQISSTDTYFSFLQKSNTCPIGVFVGVD